MNAGFKFFIFLNINLQSWLMADVPVDGELFDHPVPEFKPEDAFTNAHFPALRQKKNMTHLLKTRQTNPRPTTKPAYRILFDDECTNYAYACMRAYDTGAVCGRTMAGATKSFKNYCMLDYTNCVSLYTVWQNYHMGNCYDFVYAPNYEDWWEEGDEFLDGNTINM